jgi:hypothetical protein
MVKEKRFLVDSKNLNKIIKDIKPIEIEGFYTLLNPCKNIKYIKHNNRYYREKHFKDSTVTKKDISKKKYIKKKRCAVGSVIDKKLYLLDSESHIILNQYSSEFNNINILSINLKAMNRVKKDKNTKLLSYVEDDITLETKFKETSLALLGSPIDKNFNIYKIFKTISSKRDTDIGSIIHKNMRVDDTIRIKLYQLYINLQDISNQILKESINKKFRLYTKQLSNICNILEEFSEYFDSNLYSRVVDNIKLVLTYSDIESEIEPIRCNLKSIEEYLGPKDSMTFLSKYDKVLTQKLNSFKKFLNTREYLIIMKQLELLIKEDSYNSSNACIYKSIQTELVNKIENRYKESQKLISKDIYCKDSGNYSEISNQLDKLSMLLQLSHVIDKNKKISDPMQVILKTQDSIKKYILIVSQYKIIQDNYNNIDKIKSLKEYTNKKSNKIFKKIEHEVKCYKKSKDLFNRDL